MEISAKEIRYESPVFIWQAEKRFIIPNVFYNGEIKTYRLFERMTPEMSRDSLAEFYEIEKTKGNPVPANAPLIWAIVTRVYELSPNNQELTERLRIFLRDSFRGYSNTLSEIIYNYNGSGEDQIIHNYGTSDEFSTFQNVVGSNGWVHEILDKKFLELILDTRDLDRIDAISRWINNTNSYLWRLNSKPKEKTQGVIRFDAYEDRFGLYCNADPLNEAPAFRVLEV